MNTVTKRWLDDEIKLAEDGAEKSEYERLLALAMRELRESRKQLAEAQGILAEIMEDRPEAEYSFGLDFCERIDALLTEVGKNP